jgi:hypothetical protein
MDRTASGHLFVSYCHADEHDLLAFEKHLKGMLLDKVEVRTDQNISRGTEWNPALKSTLNQASWALV